MKPYVQERSWLLLLSLVLAGCGSNRLELLDSPDVLVLYSLDPFQVGNETEMEDSFRGYPVLGQIDLDDTATRQKVANAVMNGVAESDGTMANCFWPRHGLRVTKDSRTVDFVICFQCMQLKVYADDETQTIAIESNRRTELDAYLKAAGIPLAPDEPPDTMFEL